MIRQVLGAVAEYERAMTVLRLRCGRAHKAEQGGFAYGSPGFGWRSRDGVLVEDPEEQPAVERIRQLRTIGGAVATTGALVIILAALATMLRRH